MSFYNNTYKIRQYHSTADLHNREKFNANEIAYWIEGDVMFKRNDINEYEMKPYEACLNCVFGGKERGSGNFRTPCYGPECIKRMDRYCNYIKYELL